MNTNYLLTEQGRLICVGLYEIQTQISRARQKQQQSQRFPVRIRKSTDRWSGYENDKPMVWIRDLRTDGLDTRSTDRWSGYEIFGPMVWIRERRTDGLDTRTTDRWSGYENNGPMVWIREQRADGLDRRSMDRWSGYEIFGTCKSQTHCRK